MDEKHSIDLIEVRILNGDSQDLALSFWVY